VSSVVKPSAVTLVPPFPAKFLKILLASVEISRNLNTANQLHFTHPSGKNAEGWGTRMERESLEEEAIEIGNS